MMKTEKCAKNKLTCYTQNKKKEIAENLQLPIPEKSDPIIDPNDGYLTCAEAIAENKNN